MSGRRVILVVLAVLWLTSFVAAADTVFVSRWVHPGTSSTIYRVDTTIQGLIPTGVEQ